MRRSIKVYGGDDGILPTIGRLVMQDSFEGVEKYMYNTRLANQRSVQDYSPDPVLEGVTMDKEKTLE